MGNSIYIMKYIIPYTSAPVVKKKNDNWRELCLTYDNDIAKQVVAKVSSRKRCTVPEEGDKNVSSRMAMFYN